MNLSLLLGMMLLTIGMSFMFAVALSGNTMVLNTVLSVFDGWGIILYWVIIVVLVCGGLWYESYIMHKEDEEIFKRRGWPKDFPY